MTQKLSNAMLFKNKLIEEQEGEALQTVVVDDYLQKEVNFLPEQSKSVLTSPQKSPQKPVSILSHTSSRGSPFQSPSKQSPSRNAHFQLEDSSQNAVSSPSRFKRSEEVIQIQNEIKQMQKEEAELQKENQFKLSQQQIAKNTGLIVNSVKNTSVGPFVTQKQIKQSQNSIIAKELEFFEKLKKDNEAIQNDEEYQQIRRIPQIRKQLSISPIRNQSRYQSKQSLTPRSKVFESRNNQSSQEEESANKIKIFQLQHSRFYFHEMQAAFKKIEQANNIIEEKELFIRKQSQAIISLEQEMAAFKESVPSTRADEVAKLNVQLQQANKQIQEKNLKIQKLIHEHIDLYKSNEPYSKRRAHQKADELYEDYQGQIKKVQKSFTDQQVRFVELESENNRLNQALAQKTHENDFIRKELDNKKEILSDMYTQITMSKNSIKQLEQLVEEMKKDDTQQLKKNLIQNRSENIQLKKELHYLESKIYTVLNELEVVKDKDLVPARMLELLKAHMEMKEKETVEQKVQYKQLQKKFEDIFVQNIQKQNNHSQQHLVNDKFQIYKRDFSNHQKSTKSSKNLQEMRSVSPIQKKKSGERIKKSEDDESRLDQMIIDQSSQYPVLSDLVKKAKGEFQFKNYFQKKKVIMKIENDHIVIRIGGGYVTLEQFAKLYHTREVLANIQI